ncbi:MAG: NADH-quinone oxidoreductase subunit J [Chloroflexi bacterium]|nr:NADH-quinone oxidoreductase subunit J [Chloroflexota bacterium]
MGLEIAFWIFASVSVVSAMAVVFLSNVIRSALFLILCFLSVAGIFITLNAEFLAAAQVLIYVGAVSVLILLAITLTKEIQHGNLFNKLRIPALLAASGFLGVVIYSLINTDWVISGTPPEQTTVKLADTLFNNGGYILVLEIAILVLLVAIIGSIILVREK